MPGRWTKSIFPRLRLPHIACPPCSGLHTCWQREGGGTGCTAAASNEARDNNHSDSPRSMRQEIRLKDEEVQLLSLLHKCGIQQRLTEREGWENISSLLPPADGGAPHQDALLVLLLVFLRPVPPVVPGQHGMLLLQGDGHGGGSAIQGARPFGGRVRTEGNDLLTVFLPSCSLFSLGVLATSSWWRTLARGRDLPSSAWCATQRRTRSRRRRKSRFMVDWTTPRSSSKSCCCHCCCFVVVAIEILPASVFSGAFCIIVVLAVVAFTVIVATPAFLLTCCSCCCCFCCCFYLRR